MKKGLKIGERTLVMGILNVTPDSFYDGGRYADPGTAFEHARLMCGEGADIIDVGGESSRPGASPVSAQEEIDRVCPVIERIARELEISISIDTRKAAVAEAALGLGASIINDISALADESRMERIAASSGAYIILMHMKGTPQTMQDNPEYEDVIGEIASFLKERAGAAILAGVERERIILDPGIGFGKTAADNYAILANLPAFRKLGYPLCVGLSRKSLIGSLYDEEGDRMPATIALNAAAAQLGADIVRVHDVREHRLALAAIEMIKRAPQRDAGRI